MLFLVLRADDVVCITSRDGAVLSADVICDADPVVPTKTAMMALSIDQLLSMARRCYTQIRSGKAGGKERLADYILSIWDTLTQRLADKPKGLLSPHLGKPKLVFVANTYGTSPLMTTWGEAFLLDELVGIKNIYLTPGMLSSLGVEELKQSLLDRGIAPLKGTNKSALIHQFLEDYIQRQDEPPALVAEEIVEEQRDAEGEVDDGRPFDNPNHLPWLSLQQGWRHLGWSWVSYFE